METKEIKDRFSKVSVFDIFLVRKWIFNKFLTIYIAQNDFICRKNNQ
jgi:hypothetical protein